MVKKASTGRNGSYHPNRGRPQCKTDPPGFRPRSKQDSSLSAMAPSQSKLRIHRGQAAAPRWEPPHLFGGGALQRSEKAPYLKLRFSAGHFDTRGLRVRIASEFKPPVSHRTPSNSCLALTTSLILPRHGRSSAAFWADYFALPRA
jgi:hypothetical protein